MPKSPEQKAFDVTLSGEKLNDFTQWLCRILQDALDNRAVNPVDVRYWWTLYEQGRTRSESAPWQDAADLTSYLTTEKVDAMLARIMQTAWVDPFYTVEGWGESAKKAPFVEDFHQWALESEGTQTFLERAFLQSLIEPRGVLEVFEDTTELVTRKTINAQVRTQIDPMNPSAPPTWVMDGASMEPVLTTDAEGRYVEVTDPMTPSAQVTIDEVERVRKGPGYRVISYDNFLVLPAHAREKADIYGYAKLFTKRLDQLQECVKYGMYDKKAVESLHDSPDLTFQLSPSGESVPVTNQEGPTAEKELWEVQLLHNLDGKGLRWYVVTVHLRSRTILRIKHDDINTGRYIIFVPFPRTDRAHEGYSLVGHKLITVTEEHTAWRNMGADRAAMELSAPVKRLTTALWEPDLQPMGPKAVIDVRDMKEVEPMQFPKMTDVGIQREQDCINASERLVGVNDVALGQSAQSNQTLGELEIRTQQSFVRMDLVIKNLQEPLEELGQIRHAIWQRALASKGDSGMTAPEHLFEGLNERGGDPSKTGSVTADMLSGTFRFKPRGSTETADKSRLRNDYIQFMQALGIAFQTWPVLGATVGNNPQAAASAIEQMLRLFNIPDKQAWLAPIQQMMEAQARGQTMGQPPGMPMMPGLPGMPPGLPMPGMPQGPPAGVPPQPPMQGV